MLIFWEQRLVFLATPKAGSTAVEVALEPLASLAVQRPPSMKHVDATSFNRFIQPWLHQMTDDHFTTIALMREPIDWLRSWYRFDLRDHSDSEEQAETFQTFTRRYLGSPTSMTRGIGSQFAFLDCPAAPIDRIFAYEDIDSFTDFLDDQLGCEINLPRVNVPPAADVSLGIDDDNALRDALSKDFDLYRRISTKS